jgi:hypothetical protein
VPPVRRTAATVPSSRASASTEKPLGRGAAFKLKLERKQEFVVGAEARTITRISTDDAQRLGTLSDAAIQKMKLSKPAVLEQFEAESTGPGLLRFAARSVEIGGPYAAECKRGLTSLLSQLQAEVVWLRQHENPFEMVPALIRAANAIGKDPAKLKVHVEGSDKPVPLTRVAEFLALRQAIEERNRPAVDPRWVHGGNEVGEGGAMPFDYSTVNGSSSGDVAAPVPVAPQPPAPRQPSPRLAPAPPPYTSPAPRRPVELTPAPPRYVSPLPEAPPASRSSYVNPWEVIGSGLLDAFASARLGGFSGSWQDWLAQR